MVRKCFAFHYHMVTYEMDVYEVFFFNLLVAN